MTLAELETFDPHARLSGGRRRFLCPHCGPDKPRDTAHRSLSLDPLTGFWLCHRCQAKGKLASGAGHGASDVRGWARSVGSIGSVRSIGRSPQALTPHSQHPTADPQSPTPDRLPLLLRGLQPLVGSAAAAYLEGRGIALAVGLSAVAKYHPAFMGGPAVVFAVRDAAGRLVAIHGRYLDPDAQPKSRSAGPVKSGAVAIPLAGPWPRLTGVTPGVVDPTAVPPEPGAWEADPLILVEAPIDALSLAAAGWAAVATVGCHLPTWLPARLAFRHVLIGTDADAGGDAAAAAWAGSLRALGARVDRFRPEGAKDWNALLQRHGAAALADAVWAGIQARVRQAIEEG